jgi:uncharacterized protein (DUF488 family)
VLVDVRRFPGSGNNPVVRWEALSRSLPDVGIGYRWEPRRGGRRHLQPAEPSVDHWWTVAAFRAYTAHTRSDECGAPLNDVVSQVDSANIALMCAAPVAGCHRRLIADVVALTPAQAVRHIMSDGRQSEHRVAAGARVCGNEVLWDGAALPLGGPLIRKLKPRETKPLQGHRCEPDAACGLMCAARC